MGVSSLFVALLFFPAVASQFFSCNQKNWFFCNNSYETVASVFLIGLPVFFLSLLTYRLRDEVFRAWWNFARWFVPVIVGVTLLLNGIGRGGIGIEGALDSWFAILAIGALYYIFLAVSLIQIIRTSIFLRWQENNTLNQRLKKLNTATVLSFVIILSPAVAYLSFFLWLVVR